MSDEYTRTHIATFTFLFTSRPHFTLVLIPFGTLQVYIHCGFVAYFKLTSMFLLKIFTLFPLVFT